MDPAHIAVLAAGLGMAVGAGLATLAYVPVHLHMSRLLRECQDRLAPRLEAEAQDREHQDVIDAQLDRELL
jgi:uncharacterized membrane protein YhiD involved in acid resistance